MSAPSGFTVSLIGSTSFFSGLLASPPPIGNTTPNTGAFTTLTTTVPLAQTSGGTGVSNASFTPITAAGSTTYRSLANRFSDEINIKDYGAVCDGVTDDSAAWTAAIASAPVGSTIFIPASSASSYINSTIVINKPLTIKGSSWGAGIYCPTATCFLVTSTSVRFTNFYAYGNHSSSPANIFIYCPSGTGGVLVDNIRAEMFNTFFSAKGGAFFRFTNLAMRNFYQAGFVLDAHSGVNGNDAFFAGCSYDTDTNTYSQPAQALIWCKDFDALSIGDNNDFIHAGQVAALLIAPQVTVSSNHLIGSAYFDTVAGDGIQVNPGGSAVVSRLFIRGAWLSTCANGIRFTGSNSIIDPIVTSIDCHHNNYNGILWDNSDSSSNATTLVIGGECQFAGNNNSAGSYNDVTFAPGSASNAAKLRIYDNFFGAYDQWPGTPVYNINIGANTSSAVITNNDFTASDASSAIINGLTTTAYQTYNNRGFVTENGGISSVTAGNNSATVAHGCSRIPQYHDIWITPTSAPNSTGNWWLSAITSTTFTVTTSSNAVGSAFTFSWQVREVFP